MGGEMIISEEDVRKVRIVATLLAMMSELRDGFDFLGMERVFGHMSEMLESVLNDMDDC